MNLEFTLNLAQDDGELRDASPIEKSQGGQHVGAQTCDWRDCGSGVGIVDRRTGALGL
jgi:hypothetical protein